MEIMKKRESLHVKPLDIQKKHKNIPPKESENKRIKIESNPLVTNLGVDEHR